MAHPLRRLRLAFRATRPGLAMSDAVVVIVGIFFIFGITVGIITVVALAVLRPRQPDDPDTRDELDGSGYGPYETPSDLDLDGSGPRDRSRWPGDTDNDFSGR
jgi:hypothetical protein